MWKILLTLLFVWNFLQVVGAQGMVPLSPVIDHDHSNPPASAPTTDTNEQVHDAKTHPLSPEKIKSHKEIAATHLELSERTNENPGRVSVKDKPANLQNPEKHMAETFVLDFLLKQYPKSENVEEQVEILQNLENFSHKWENGRDLFKATNALKEILLPALNSSSDLVRQSSCAVFAVAAQNNKDVQDVAVEAGVVRAMVHLITFDQSVRPKALLALSSLVRNFPKGQDKLIKDGGIPVLVKIASLSETRKRSLNFITDLLQELSYCKIYPPQEDKETTPCESLTSLEQLLFQSGWCNVLIECVKNIPGFDTEDQILTAAAVASSIHFCSEKVAPFSNIFHHLYGKLEKEDFLTEANAVKDIIKIIDPLYGKDEL